MAFVTNNMSGALFSNDKGSNPNRPDMTGTVKVDDVEYDISAWNKTSGRGLQFLSLSFSPKGQREAQATPSPSSRPTSENPADYSDDVPF